MALYVAPRVAVFPPPLLISHKEAGAVGRGADIIVAGWRRCGRCELAGSLAAASACLAAAARRGGEHFHECFFLFLLRRPGGRGVVVNRGPAKVPVRAARSQRGRNALFLLKKKKKRAGIASAGLCGNATRRGTNDTRQN